MKLKVTRAHNGSHWDIRDGVCCNCFRVSSMHSASHDSLTTSNNDPRCLDCFDTFEEFNSASRKYSQISSVFYDYLGDLPIGQRKWIRVETPDRVTKALRLISQLTPTDKSYHQKVHGSNRLWDVGGCFDCFYDGGSFEAEAGQGEPGGPPPWAVLTY